MFRFNFDVESAEALEDPSNNFGEPSGPSTRPDLPQSADDLEPCMEIPIQDLLRALPSRITGTPLIIERRDKTEPICLPRRDLYDARFQLIAEEQEFPPEDAPVQPSENHEEYRDSKRLLRTVDAPHDVIPFEYEGGLKTWECSLDLVQHLDGDQDLLVSLMGKSIIEVGCGTAIPSLFLMTHVFQMDACENAKKTEFHLQDYNRSVLELITMPNIIMTWYYSEAATAYREAGTGVKAIPIEGFTIDLSTELLDAFTESLRSRNMSIRFYAGAWQTYRPTTSSGRPFDLVLTSETIYRQKSIPSLLAVLKTASKSSVEGSELDDILPGLSIRATLILVAAKAMYFGVGGNVDDFRRAAEDVGAVVTDVWELPTGVRRVILKLTW